MRSIYPSGSAMLKQKLLIPVIAASAFGGYSAYNHPEMFDAGNSGSETIGTIDTEKYLKLATAPPPPPVIQNIANLEQVIRFDVYPNWVKSNWPRVSTAPVGLGLSGMRVSLVTGTRPSDLTGSMTYFFDDTHRVQRIQFVGRTDDATQLVALLTQKYNFKTEKSLDAGFYVAKQGRKPIGVLKLQHPKSVYTNRPGQILVTMELLAPKSRFDLSREATGMLNSASGY